MGVDIDVEPEAAHPAGEPAVAEGEETRSASPEALQDFFRQPGSGSPAPSDRDQEDAPAAAPPSPPAPPDKGKRVTSQGVCDVCGHNPVWSIQHQRWFCEHCQRII